MTETVDMIVIGGGVAGVGVAARLAAEAQVALVETEPALGVHATGRSAAMFIANYGPSVWRTLAAESRGFLESPDEIGESSLLSPRGELVIAAPDETQALDAYLEGASGMERLSPREALELVPLLREDRLAAAALEAGACDLDVDRLLQGFARLLRRRGGRVALGAPVGAIAREAGAWRVDCGAAGAFSAPVVVNAAGGWADAVATIAGVAPLGLRTLRRSAAIVPAPKGHEIERWPMVASAANAFYAKPDAGRLMISPSEEDPVAPGDVWADDMTLAEGIDRFQQAFDYEVRRVERSWAGLRTFAPDGLPLVGFAPEAQGFFWLAGQGGYGVQTAPALSRLAADLIAGRAADWPTEVVEVVAPSRFTTAGIGR